MLLSPSPFFFFFSWNAIKRPDIKGTTVTFHLFTIRNSESICDSDWELPNLFLFFLQNSIQGCFSGTFSDSKLRIGVKMDVSRLRPFKTSCCESEADPRIVLDSLDHQIQHRGSCLERTHRTNLWRKHLGVSAALASLSTYIPPSSISGSFVFDLKNRFINMWILVTETRASSCSTWEIQLLVCFNGANANTCLTGSKSLYRLSRVNRCTKGWDGNIPEASCMCENHQNLLQRR